MLEKDFSIDNYSSAFCLLPFSNNLCYMFSYLLISPPPIMPLLVTFIILSNYYKIDIYTQSFKVVIISSEFYWIIHLFFNAVKDILGQFSHIKTKVPSQSTETDERQMIHAGTRNSRGLILTAWPLISGLTPWRLPNKNIILCPINVIFLPFYTLYFCGMLLSNLVDFNKVPHLCNLFQVGICLFTPGASEFPYCLGFNNEIKLN